MLSSADGVVVTMQAERPGPFEVYGFVWWTREKKINKSSNKDIDKSSSAVGCKRLKDC